VGATKITGVLTLTSTISNGTYAYTLPSATGTLALTSALSSYLPLAGGTLTGALSGTSATFSATVRLTSFLRLTKGSSSIVYDSSGNVVRFETVIINTESGSNTGSDFAIYSYNDAGNYLATPLTITRSTGAATFSSSVTAGGNIDITTNAYLGGLLKISRALGDPATTGSADPNYFSRYFDSAGSRTLDIGVSNSGAWLQSRDKNSYAVNYPLLLQPNGGNVGIGTSSPSAPLYILAPTTIVDSNGQLFVGASDVLGADKGGQIMLGGKYTSTVNTAFGGIAAKKDNATDGNFGGYLQFFSSTHGVGNTEKMRITSAGNVGIGTTSPSAISTYTTLDIRGGTGGGLRMGVSGSSTPFNLQQAGTDAYLNNVASGIMYFLNGDSERMRISSTGFTKMSNNGTYNSAVGAYHEITSSTTNNNVLILRNTSASPYGPYFGFPNASPNNGVNYFLDCSDSTAIRLQLRSNGGLANYAANDVNLSDIRTKKDIVPLGSYWDKFKAIEIVKFKYKDQSHDDYNIGVISQQVESVAPEFVDIDGFGTTPEDGIPLKSIYTADLYHATIKVLQEAMIKIEELSAEITILKNK